MSFEIEKTNIKGLLLIKLKFFRDDRGFFLETYKKSDFIKIGINISFVQDNHSKSVKDVLRGLHYQKEPYSQAKLIRCIKGSVWDVAVDIRKGSPTFAKWYGIELNEENGYMLYIPEGFVHGFCVLSEEAEIIYKCSCEYMPEYDAGIRYDDPLLKIDWPVKNPILSEKDKNLPFLSSEKYKELGNNI